MAARVQYLYSGHFEVRRRAAKDGILDVDDLCPNDPETFNGYQDADGCPDKAPGRR